MAVPIIPRLVRGRLYFGPALFPTFAQAVTAWSAADAHRLDMAQPLGQQPQPPLRRRDDCQLDLGRDVLRALGSCPRWGMVRKEIQSRCPAFVAKKGGRTSVALDADGSAGSDAAVRQFAAGGAA